jgi:hypothetical protein
MLSYLEAYCIKGGSFARHASFLSRDTPDKGAADSLLFPTFVQVTMSRFIVQVLLGSSEVSVLYFLSSFSSAASARITACQARCTAVVRHTCLFALYLRNLIEIRMVHLRRRSTTAAASAPAPARARAAPPAAAMTTVTMTGAGALTASRTAGKSGWRMRRRDPSARWRAHAASHPESELALSLLQSSPFLFRICAFATRQPFSMLAKSRWKPCELDSACCFGLGFSKN